MEFLIYEFSKCMKPKSIELLAFDRNQNLQYAGKCKLQINRLSSLLLVEPENEEYKMISAMYKWNFIMDKNILFIFAEHEISDFALVFDEEKRSKKVYDFISKDKTQNELDKDMLFQRFLNPICEKIAKNNEATANLKRIISKWVQKHNDQERKELIKLLNDKQTFNIVYPSVCIEAGESKSLFLCEEADFAASNIVNKRAHDIRKRRHSAANDFQNNNNEQKQKLPKKYLQITDHSLFKIVSVQTEFSFHRRLLIFTNSSKSHCLEYSWNNRGNQFYCIECKAKRKYVVKLDKDENGVECIKMQDKNHLCTPLRYIHEKYIEMKIFKKPDYEILENCNATSGVMLIIFKENDRNQCLEFRVHDNKCSFRCRKCDIPAKLWNDATENEYVELRDANHNCRFIPYAPEKYYQFNEFVLSSNFEVVQTYSKNGEEKTRLVIFDKTDRTLCYVYQHVYSHGHKMFHCQSCDNKKVVVSAKLLKNSDGEDYIILSNKNHTCKPRLYSTLCKIDTILHPPAIELMENNENGINKLFIFDSNDRKLCYTFSQRKGCQNGYYCLGCRQVIRNSKKKDDDRKRVPAQLCKNESGEPFVRLNDAKKHVCKPRKYEPEKFKQCNKCYDYFLFRRKSFPQSLCYENGKEYFNHNYKKHACRPVEVSSIRAPQFIILKREEINFEEKAKKKEMPALDESRIVKSPNFELRPNAKGVEDGSLFVFHSNDRNIGYKYYYNIIDANNKRYFCCKKPVCYVSAKVEITENGEKLVILGPNQHKCEPVKYEPFCRAATIIKKSEFVTVNTEDKLTTIIVFTTSSRNECYEFGLTQRGQHFNCLGCSRLRKNLTVKLCKDENGEEFLKMSKENHFCQPRKYIKEKYQPKTIPSELFELHPNTKGETDKRLVVFTSDKKDFVYEYSWKHAKSYGCIGCVSKTANVLAKVCEDKNGEKFVEFGLREHICKPRKYDPKKYIPTKPNIISNNLFLFKDGCDGKKDKHLLIFISEKKDFMYQYVMDGPGYYRCSRCRLQRKNISAKVVENNDGSKCVKLCENEHICQPRKYDHTDRQPKIILNEFFELQPNSKGDANKRMIIFTSDKKDFVYQYFWYEPRRYKCNSCSNKKTFVIAKLMENGDGIKFVELGKKEHICKPLKYDPKKDRIHGVFLV